MGCDIHIVIAKHKDGKTEVVHDTESGVRDNHGSWEEHWKKWRLATGRNYQRFAKLSGVRGNGPLANGWPDWAKDTFPDMVNDSDLHSHTHYKIKQAAKLWLKTEWFTTNGPNVPEVLLLAKANPISMYFHVDSNRSDLDDIFVLICYDN